MRLLFDFDGTLADTLPWLLQNAFPRISRKYHLKILTSAEHDELRHLPIRETFKRTGVTWWKLPFLVRDIRRIMRDEMPRIPLYPGIPEMLKQLAVDGHQLGLATSNSEANVARALGPELMSLIGPLRICGASMHGKATRIKKVLRLRKIPPQTVVLVGDELRDGEAARQARVAFAAVTWGYNSAQSHQTAAPDFLFDTPAQLAAHFHNNPPSN